jgi:hypothetical protein
MIYLRMRKINQSFAVYSAALAAAEANFSDLPHC